MSRVNELLSDLCPDGIEFVPLSELTRPVGRVDWSSVDPDEPRQYIDLATVDRSTHSILGTQTITATTAPDRAQQLVSRGDVLFGTTRPTLQRYCVVPRSYDGQVCSSGFCVLRPNSDRLLVNFLFHSLGSPAFRAYVEAQQRGSNYPAISDRAIKRFRIALPPLEVQAEIVRVLDSYASLEAELASGLTREMDARRRQFSYYRSGLLPCGIERADWKPLADLASFQYGMTATAQATGALRFIRITDISESGKLVSGPIKYVADDPNAAAYLVGEGDLLVARTGASYGKTVLIGSDDRGAFASFLVRILVDREALLPSYYWHFAQSDLYWRQARSLVSVGGQPQFNANAIARIRVPVPTLESQKRSAEVLGRFDGATRSLSANLLAELRARRRQFEYYRDRLLTFEEAA